jgi:hypothetical protein
MTTPRPLFLFSLPRSGSTLLQRALAAHPDISTVSEPWILLPLLYARRSEGAYAEYDHGLAKGAVDDFVATLPEGGADYDEAVRAFAGHLYARAARPGAAYFVDKTPRYHLVVEDVLRVFPDAKFVFLWRNPLAVAASIMNTYAAGRWNLYLCKVDLYDGLARLVEAFAANGNRAYALRYDDLLADPATQLGELCDYLGLPRQPSMVAALDGVALNGRLGDRDGRYRGFAAEPLDSWRTTFGNPLRRRWARRYLDWLGADRLATMGYEIAELRAALAAGSAELDGVGSDAARMLYGMVWSGFEPVLVRDKLRHLRERRTIHAHP